MYPLMKFLKYHSLMKELGNENIQNTQTSNSEDMNNFDYDNNDSVSDDDNNPIPPDYFRVEEEAQLPHNHFENELF